MSGKKAREYRSAAMANGSRANVLNEGARGYMTKWRRFAAWLFHRLRRKYDHIIGWWYKRWLKHEARRIAQIMRDPDTMAFYKARAKMARQKKAISK